MPKLSVSMLCFKPKFDYLSGWSSSLLDSIVVCICIIICARFCFIKLEICVDWLLKNYLVIVFMRGTLFVVVQSRYPKNLVNWSPKRRGKQKKHKTPAGLKKLGDKMGHFHTTQRVGSLSLQKKPSLERSRYALGPSYHPLTSPFCSE